MAAETATGCSTVAAAKMMAGPDSQAATASGRTQQGCSSEAAKLPDLCRDQQDCNCRQQMSRQGGMQRYDRELKESAAFDSVPGMEMTDGDPYPVYRETDEVR